MGSEDTVEHRNVSITRRTEEPTRKRNFKIDQYSLSAQVM